MAAEDDPALNEPEVTAGHPEDEPESDPKHEDHPEADDAETFPREYVEKLRKESKGYRERAKTAEANLDATLRELFRFKVERNGKLADPEDLKYDAELLADDDALDAAVDDLLAKHPHYAKRKVGGTVGQGVTGTKDEPFSLMGRLSQAV
ncbi:hypothetical protein ACAG24_017635 [Mycobacterium sp. pW049]|uniref:hypothetical protein n=1 Tax=[Mycobacterium] bulgaricum TaxID=3238985 RepID=UPI00351B11DC